MLLLLTDHPTRWLLTLYSLCGVSTPSPFRLRRPAALFTTIIPSWIMSSGMIQCSCTVYLNRRTLILMCTPPCSTGTGLYDIPTNRSVYAGFLQPVRIHGDNDRIFADKFALLEPSSGYFDLTCPVGIKVNSSYLLEGCHRTVCSSQNTMR